MFLLIPIRGQAILTLKVSQLVTVIRTKTHCDFSLNSKAGLSCKTKIFATKGKSAVGDSWPENNKGPEGRLTEEASRGPRRGDSSNTGPGTDSCRAKRRVQDTSAIKNGSCDMAWPDDKSMNRMDGNLYIHQRKL